MWQARQLPNSLLPAAGFEARPKESAGKIEWPTAVHTVFEGPGECSQQLRVSVISVDEQLPGVVRMAMGATVSRISIS